jgi:hypothetical protein
MAWPKASRRALWQAALNSGVQPADQRSAPETGDAVRLLDRRLRTAAGDNVSFGVNQNWVVGSELGDIGHDPRYLRVGVVRGLGA